MTDVTTTDKPARRRNLTHLVAMRCETELYDAIYLEAVKERRSLGGWLRMVVLDRLAGDAPLSHPRATPIERVADQAVFDATGKDPR